MRSLTSVGGWTLAVILLPAMTIAASIGSGVDKATPHDLAAMKAEYGRSTEIPTPADNAYSVERVRLGKALFFDPRLSGSGVLSCASCHNPLLGWADGLATGIGHKGTVLARHTPGIENLAWGGPYFWDGRAWTLEEQAKGPLQAEKEMNMPLASVVSLVSSLQGYRDAFAAAYPGEPITIGTIAKAIANFERTLVSAQAPFDRWIEGDERAISESAKRGFVLFNTKARCAVCHQGWRFSDDGFHDIGLKSDDKGRGQVIAGVVPLTYAFKTPGLRNVARTAPYMHDGSEKTLRDVIDFYDGRFVKRASLSTDMKELNLTAGEKNDLLAFLNTLSSDEEEITLPQLPQR
jgi:cytochrome c peroxidase